MRLAKWQAANCGFLLCMAGSFACGRIGYEFADVDTDSGTLIDSSTPASMDALVDMRLSCAQPPNGGSIAVYDFNTDSGGPLADSVGSNTGTTVGTAQYIPGPIPDCGTAFSVTGTIANYGVIADSPLWLISEGSVDFWFRVAGFPSELASLLSRDALGTDAGGHFNVLISSDRRVGVRIQGMASNGDLGANCSAPDSLSVNTWNHVGANFGAAGLEVWLNGEVVNAPGMLDRIVCQSGNELGIEGNMNPWTIAVNSGFSTEGSATPVGSPFAGALDHIRISSIRRDFSGAPYTPPN